MNIGFYTVEHGQCLDLIIHVTWNCWILDFEQSTLFFLADGYTRYYTMVHHGGSAFIRSEIAFLSADSAAHKDSRPRPSHFASDFSLYLENSQPKKSIQMNAFWYNRVSQKSVVHGIKVYFKVYFDLILNDYFS